MEANATIPKITTTIRLPEELHFKLVKRSNSENRSLSNLIETILLGEMNEESEGLTIVKS